MPSRFAAVVLAVAAGCARPAAPPPASQPLSHRLAGAWTYVAGPDAVAGERIKWFTADRWEVLQIDPAGRVVLRHGGPYTTDGDVVTAQTTYAEGLSPPAGGPPHSLRVEIDGDTLRQTGLDNPYHEVWRRK